MDCTFEAERWFGPAITQCRRAFDFTLFFEELFFRLLPSTLFIIATIARIAVLIKSSPRVRPSVLCYAKIAIVTVFAALELTLLVLTCTRDQDNTTQLSVPTAALCFVAAVALVALSYFEHIRSPRSSNLLGFYLLITTLLRAAVVRTYWFIDGFHAIASISLTSLLVQIGILALESCSKRRWLIDSSRGGSPEESASFLSRSLFAWINHLFLIGYRRQLTDFDVQIIDSSLSGQGLEPQYEGLVATKKFGRHGLVWLSFRCLGLYAFAPVLPRLAVSAFTFSQPFLASALIEFLDNRNAPVNNGYGLIGASFLVYTGIAISNAWYYYVTYKLATKIRGGLITAINHKLLKLKQNKDAESKALTIIISDLQRITGTLGFVQELWVSPIETAIATWLLWRQVGPSSLAALGIVVVCMVASTFVGKRNAAQQRVWLAATERRLQATKHMLSSLKAIKMTGADKRAAAVIENLRLLEFAASRMFRRLGVAGLISSFATMSLAPVIVFAAYIGATASQHQDLDANRLFSSLILINLMANPLVLLLQVFTQVGAALGCYGRVQDFLESEEISDSREHIRPSAGDDKPIPATENKVAEESEKSNSDIQRKGPIVTITDGCFGWDKVLVKDVNFRISKGEHVVVTGAVGTGKSLLLQGIIGEVPPISGNITVRDDQIAYCGQTPWLENSAPHENAFRGAPGDQIWRERVIDACALREFFDAQVDGTTIGSGGAKISGGERQRLALARAVALRPSLILLDDVFSAIDRTTKKHILESLFGRSGLLMELGTAIIQVTQDAHVAEFASSVLSIKDGNLVPHEFENSAYKTQHSADSVDGEELEDPKYTLTQPEKAEKKAQAAQNLRIADRQVYRTYFSAIGWTHVAIFFALGVTYAFTLRFPAVWVQWWSADESKTLSRSHPTSYWIGLYALLNILPLILITVWSGHLILTIVPVSGIGLHKRLLKTVLNATFVLISAIDTGDLINRFNQDLTFVDTRLPIDLLNTVSALFEIIAQLILIAIAAIYVLAAVPVVFLALFLIQHVYLRTSKQLRQLDLQSKAMLQARTSETYLGLSTIRAHGWQRMMFADLREGLDRTQEPQYLLSMIQTWLRMVLYLLVAGLSVVVVGVAVSTRRGEDSGAIGVALLNLVTLGSGLSNFIASWTSLETSLGAIARIEAFERDTPAEPGVSSPVEVPANWPEKGELKFEGLHASYNTNATKEKPVYSLQDISLHIKPGERIAVCGRSGSGKSTLLLALLALIDCPKGKILLDDVDTSLVPRSLLRSRFHVISQDVFTQSGGSVREALDPDAAFSDEVIEDILRECSILDNITAAGGLSAELSDAKLSVGEAQLFVLARTIVQAEGRPGGVVLLDEATSSIDVATEKKIMALIERKLRGKTIISVLHRLEVALEYDRILVLENSKIAHLGTPTEVLRDSELFSSIRKANR